MTVNEHEAQPPVAESGPCTAAPASAPARALRRWPGVLVILACVGIGAVALERLSRPVDPVPAEDDDPSPALPSPPSAEQLRDQLLAQAQYPVPTEITAMYAEGEKLAEDLVQSLSECAEGLCFAGRMYRSFRDSAKAIPCWEKCRRLAPDVPDPHFCLGAVAWEQGKYEASAAHLREAVKLDPSLTNAFLFLGSSLVNSGKPQEAISAMDTASPSVRETPEIHMVLAHAHLDLRNYDKARQHFEAALSANGGLASAHYGLMTVFMRIRQPEKAREHQKNYQKLIDDDRKARLSANSVERHRAELRTAIAAFYLTAGEISLKHGRPDLAGKYWARGTQFAPQNAKLRAVLETLCSRAVGGTASAVRGSPDPAQGPTEGLQ